MTSIRKRLLLNLLGLFLFSWLAVAGFTYYQATHEIEEVFDAQLAQTAGMIAEIMLDRLPQKGQETSELAKAVYGHKYERKVSFQIWEGNKLLLHSQSAPHERLSSQMGFSDRPIGKTTWRVFGMRHESNNYTVYSAEDYEVRNEMISFIAQGALFPLLWALPLLGVFIWLGIGQGLLPLKRVASEVSERTPQQLTPINSEGVPQEITPLTTALNTLLKKLRDAFDMEKRFTADASHELRTPLAGIRTQAQVALRSTDNEERQRALQNILQGVDRSTHLVEQMLTLARLEPETLTQEFETVQLATLAESIVADLVPLATERGIELSLTNNSLDCSINGYEPGLCIMLRNLVDNAIRYTPDSGTVDIAINQDNDHCCLSVTDTGPGIPEPERERVFDRFYRQEGRNGYGCGLGLSIVRHIAQLHHASITLEENPAGQGLQITIRF